MNQEDDGMDMPLKSTRNGGAKAIRLGISLSVRRALTVSVPCLHVQRLG